MGEEKEINEEAEILGPFVYKYFPEDGELKYNFIDDLLDMISKLNTLKHERDCAATQKIMDKYKHLLVGDT